MKAGSEMISSKAALQKDSLSSWVQAHSFLDLKNSSIGVSTGEDKDVKVTFPEEYHAADLAGKEAVFKCKVHEVKEEEIPEINDEFVKDISEFDTTGRIQELTSEKELEKAAEASKGRKHR